MIPSNGRSGLVMKPSSPVFNGLLVVGFCGIRVRSVGGISVPTRVVVITSWRGRGDTFRLISATGGEDNNATRSGKTIFEGSGIPIKDGVSISGDGQRKVIGLAPIYFSITTIMIISRVPVGGVSAEVFDDPMIRIYPRGMNDG